MAYTIKRYANRKLYDPQESQYVTLAELAALVRRGEDVRVVDASSGEDVTGVILAQVILEQARTGQAALPAALLQQLIKHGEAWQDFLQQSLSASLEGIVTGQRELDRILRDWVARAGLLPAAPFRAPAAGRSERPGTPPGELRDEVAALRRQLQALERRLGRKRRSVKRRARK